mmetsp:Transcript_43542/g.94845  ORF Transcript_43542/g.94845 Transcript_43542/m.94845 type:complete len:212 (+) Transcript_43542:135-770(+)
MLRGQAALEDAVLLDAGAKRSVRLQGVIVLDAGAERELLEVAAALEDGAERKLDVRVLLGELDHQFVHMYELVTVRVPGQVVVHVRVAAEPARCRARSSTAPGHDTAPFGAPAGVARGRRGGGVVAPASEVWTPVGVVATRVLPLRRSAPDGRPVRLLLLLGDGPDALVALRLEVALVLRSVDHDHHGHRESKGGRGSWGVSLSQASETLA